MKRGFYTIMAAQFFSSLADNALFVAAVELIRANGKPDAEGNINIDRNSPAFQGFVAAIDALAPGRGFVLYSYCATSPIPTAKLGLEGRRAAWTPLNFPPASVWRYVPRAGAR